MFRIFLTLFILFFCSSNLWAQVDSIASLQKRIQLLEEQLKKDSIFKKNYEDITFYIANDLQNQKRGLTIEGYIDAYCAYYTDSLAPGAFNKIPSISPRTGMGLNSIALCAKYNSEKLRSTITLHYGDVPKSAWSPDYNLIQEANFGIKLLDKLWLDMGFFRTHLGVESIQTRENFTVSLAAATFYEPYFLSGAKLSYTLNEHISIQAHFFNSFNNHVDNNYKKTTGLSVHYQKGKSFVSYNNLLTDESAVDLGRSQLRLYQNIYMASKRPKMDWTAEMNFCLQTNSVLTDSTKTAYVYSSILGAKYKFNEHKGIYCRLEAFHDTNEVLTGLILSENTKIVGLEMFGITAGIEYKPVTNSYVRLESRYINTSAEEKIFYHNHQYQHYRWEFHLASGIWF